MQQVQQHHRVDPAAQADQYRTMGGQQRQYLRRDPFWKMSACQEMSFANIYRLIAGARYIEPNFATRIEQGVMNHAPAILLYQPHVGARRAVTYSATSLYLP
jgi:hypothetical protein